MRGALGLGWSLSVGGMVLLMDPAAVWAQPAPGPAASSTTATPDAATLAARAAYALGVKAADAGHWEVAHARYHEAWMLKQHWQIALNLAEAEHRIGKHKDAVEHLAFFLQSAEANARRGKEAEAERKQATTWLAEARAKLGALRFVDLPAGTTVRIDGQTIGTAPLAEPVQLDPRAHEIDARLGDKTAHQTVEAVTGKTIEVTLVLQGPPTARAAVSPTAVSPTAPRKAGEETDRPFPKRTVVLVGGAALGAVGVGIGVGAGVASLLKQNEQDNCLTRAASEQETCWLAVDPERRNLAAPSLAGFVVGGLAAAGTLVYYLAGPRPTAGGTTLGVRVGPTGPGILLSGSW